MASLNFKGKGIVQNYHLSVPFHELVPDKKKGLSDKPRLDDNLIIHGDNLKALKALLPTYAGKVKCIYIDPPYNTGNEGWAYNDNVNNPMMKEWLGKTVDTEDLTRHDKWLCMMMPRLKLLRELLSDDGAIFVSIDDNEVHHLRDLMNEVFGEDNFVSTIIWEKAYSPKSTAKFFSENHDYIMVFARKKDKFKLGMLPRTEAANARYGNPDKDPRGPWKPGDLSARNFYSKGTYSIKCPGGRVINRPPSGRYWAVSKEKLFEMNADNRIWWGEDKNQVPSNKQFLSEVRQGLVPETIWTYKEVGHTQDAKKEILSILNFESSDEVFVTVKPSTLVRRILELATDKNSIVLDSFAGTGTSAHAVLALNREDGGKRKYILVEMEDYADKITAERVRRVIKGVKGAKDENLRKGLGGSFSYFELGDAIDVDQMLTGKKLPSFESLARYVFYTATGEEFNAKKLNQKTHFVGESKEYEVYLYYEPDLGYLKKTAFNLEAAEKLGKPGKKRRLVFAPTKYLSQDDLDTYKVDFQQLPFDIYKQLGA